jgi:Protein of unknown function (DUF3047)
MGWRVRHFLIGGVAFVIVVGLIGWHFWGGRGEVLKPDGGPVVTVMDFGRSFPRDPLPSGWRHRKFWTRSPVTVGFTVKEGVPSMRFETHDSASMLFRSVDIDLAAYPMLAWRWYIELPIRRPLDERTREGDDHPARLFLRFITDRGERRAMEVIWGNRLKRETINTSAISRTLLPTPATIGSAAGLTRGSTLPASMPRSGRMRRPRTWSMSPCSATATTPTPPASATLPMCDLSGDEARTFKLNLTHESLLLDPQSRTAQWTDRRFSDRAHRTKT